MRKKFPQFVYVSFKGESGKEWLDANATALEAIVDDGPTEVGTYKLIAVSDLSKQVVSKPRKKGT